MNARDKKILAAMPKLAARRVEVLLEDVLGCRWTVSVLRAVASGVRRPGALERHINGISTKVLNDRLRAFTRVGIFERVQFPEIPPRVEYHLTDFGQKFLTLLKAVEKLQRELIAEAERYPVDSLLLGRSAFSAMLLTPGQIPKRKRHALTNRVSETCNHR